MNAISGSAACASVRWSTKLGSRTPTARAGVKGGAIRARARREVVTRATFGGDAPESSTAMDYEGALKFLGLSETYTSEDMVKAKKQMRSRYEDEEEKLQTVIFTRVFTICRRLFPLVNREPSALWKRESRGVS